MASPTTHHTCPTFAWIEPTTFIGTNGSLLTGATRPKEAAAPRRSFVMRVRACTSTPWSDGSPVSWPSVLHLLCEGNIRFNAVLPLVPTSIHSTSRRSFVETAPTRKTWLWSAFGRHHVPSRCVSDAKTYPAADSLLQMMHHHAPFICPQDDSCISYNDGNSRHSFGLERTVQGQYAFASGKNVSGRWPVRFVYSNIVTERNRGLASAAETVITPVLVLHPLHGCS